MQKDKVRAQNAVQRDLRAAALPVKIPVQKILFQLQGMILDAIKSGDTALIEDLCRGRLLEALNAATVRFPFLRADSGRNCRPKRLSTNRR